MAKILLVEDEELENERLAALLRSFGHDVTIMSPERLASDAMLGLSAAPRYDVIITDADAWKSSRDALTHAMRGIFPDAKILKVEDKESTGDARPRARARALM